jgi:hypothetical protein
MPARIPRPDPATTTTLPVDMVITTHRQLEVAGIDIRRPFPGELSLAAARAIHGRGFSFGRCRLRPDRRVDSCEVRA